MSQTRVGAMLPAQPVAEDAPLPSRKVLRSWLLDLAEKTTALPIVLLVVDYIIYGVLIAAAIAAPHWSLRLLAGLVAGFWIAANALGALVHREAAKTANLNPLSHR